MMTETRLTSTVEVGGKIESTESQPWVGEKSIQKQFALGKVVFRNFGTLMYVQCSPEDDVYCPCERSTFKIVFIEDLQHVKHKR